MYEFGVYYLERVKQPANVHLRNAKRL